MPVDARETYRGRFPSRSAVAALVALGVLSLVDAVEAPETIAAPAAQPPDSAFQVAQQAPEASAGPGEEGSINVPSDPGAAPSPADTPGDAKAVPTASDPTAPVPQPTPTPEVACGTHGAVYWAGSGPEVQVVRRGTMDQHNPLRPAPDPPAVVLQVSIGGKTATAYGPSFESMHRAGPPQQLEEESGSRIKWDSNLDGLPSTFQIVAEDGPEIIARLQFQKCAPPPKQARERDRPGQAQAPARASKPPAGGGRPRQPSSRQGAPP
jgi:hypothetical protein